MQSIAAIILIFVLTITFYLTEAETVIAIVGWGFALCFFGFWLYFAVFLWPEIEAHAKQAEANKRMEKAQKEGHRLNIEWDEMKEEGKIAKWLAKKEKQKRRKIAVKKAKKREEK